MYKKGAKLILRPPKSIYSIQKMPITYDLQNFDRKIERIPIAFQSSQNQILHGSFYHASNIKCDCCLIYLHGNASNQLEGRYLVSIFAPLGIPVFCFDFAGCGCSSGKYISLGYYETLDVGAVLSLLTTDFGMNQFLLWGRSMGAAVSILSLEKYSNILAAVVDSPYTSIVSLMTQLARSKKIPKWLIKRSIQKIRKRIQKKAQFDIYEVSPISKVENIEKPIFFIHGTEDLFVVPDNSQQLFDSCPSQFKEIHLVPGEHDSDRPQDILKMATTFLCRSIGMYITFSDDSAPNESPPNQASRQHYRNVQDMIDSME